MMEVKFISIDEFLKSKEQYFIIDVRNSLEYSNGHIEGAVNIPFSILKVKINEIPKDKKIITYCNDSTSGEIASLILREFGLDVYALEGGFRSYCTKK